MKQLNGLKRKTPLRRESPKRAGDRAIYMVKREKFLRANPLCLATATIRTFLGLPPIDPPQATDVHHVHGRLGDNYLDEKTWISISRWAHTWIHDNPKEARDLGLLA